MSAHPRTAFRIYQDEQRAAVKTEFPDAKPSAMLKLLAARWKELDAPARKVYVRTYGAHSSRPQCYTARSHARAASALLVQEERAAEEQQQYKARVPTAQEETDLATAEQQFQPKDITEEQRLKFVRTRVQLVKGVLSESDIAELDATYERIKTLAVHQADAAGTDELTHPNLGGLKDSPHLTCFLHVHALIDKQLPHILKKVLDTMVAADRQAGWGLLSAQCAEHEGEAGCSNIRVVEYHEYRKGGEVCDPTHTDAGSLVTMSVMLSDPAADFTGGEFTTLEEDGSVTGFQGFGRGDGLVFISEKWHSVQEVRTGTRRSLVTELWAGPRELQPSSRYAF